MGNRAAAADLIGEELKLIRKNVPGVHGSVAATSDGLLIAHDVHDMEPTQIAALVAALHAVAVRATLSTGSGTSGTSSPAPARGSSRCSPQAAARSWRCSEPPA